MDGLKGFPEAIETVFPKTIVQLCIVHLIRNSLQFVDWKKRKEAAADLRGTPRPQPLMRLNVNSGYLKIVGDIYPSIAQIWRRNWSRVIPFFDYPPEIRRVIYTANAIESVNMSLRKITKNRGSFPSDDAVMKLFYLGIRNISKKWTMPIRDWKAALNRFSILFQDRMPQF